MSSLIQVVFAVFVGFVLVLIFHYGGSLIPFIVFHSANNAFKIFEADQIMDPKMEMVVNLILIFAVLGGYLLYLIRTFSKEADSCS